MGFKSKITRSCSNYQALYLYKYNKILIKVADLWRFIIVTGSKTRNGYYSFITLQKFIRLGTFYMYIYIYLSALYANLFCTYSVKFVFISNVEFHIFWA